MRIVLPDLGNGNLSKSSKRRQSCAVRASEVAVNYSQLRQETIQNARRKGRDASPRRSDTAPNRPSVHGRPVLLIQAIGVVVMKVIRRQAPRALHTDRHVYHGHSLCLCLANLASSARIQVLPFPRFFPDTNEATTTPGTPGPIIGQHLCSTAGQASNAGRLLSNTLLSQLAAVSPLSPSVCLSTI